MNFDWVLATFGIFGLVLILVSAAMVPMIGIVYLLLRVRRRREAFLALFTDPGVCGPYLTSRGHFVKRLVNETAEQQAERLKEECEAYCRREFSGEFGKLHWLLPLLTSTIAGAIVIFILVAVVFKTPLTPDNPKALYAALLGGVVWNYYVVIRDYTRTDLSPGSFYWMTFRYLLATSFGVLSESVLAKGIAVPGAFLMALIPFEERFDF